MVSHLSDPPGLGLSSCRRSEFCVSRPLQARVLGPTSCPAPPCGGPPSPGFRRDGAGDLVTGQRFSVETIRVHSPGASSVMPGDIEHTQRRPRCLLAAAYHRISPPCNYDDSSPFLCVNRSTCAACIIGSDANDAAFDPASPQRRVHTVATGVAFNAASVRGRAGRNRRMSLSRNTSKNTSRLER